MGVIIPMDRIRKKMERKEYIEREAAIENAISQMRVSKSEFCMRERLMNIPAADVRPVPDGGIGEMSDGYHTFNGLYYQRMVLFAALVKAHKDKAWKSWRHEDGELCFGGGWFIVGIDTPEGSYTYHYEDKDWDRFECEELPVAKHWDGHTEEDVTRLLSLAVRPVVPKWIPVAERLPGMYVPCLLYNSSQPTMVGWRIDEKRFRIPGSFLPDHPTHWMPLPTPPKEETT